jgi:hypothetical protein
LFELIYLNKNAWEVNRCPTVVGMVFIGKCIPSRPGFFAPQAIYISVSHLNTNNTSKDKVSITKLFHNITSKHQLQTNF